MASRMSGRDCLAHAVGLLTALLWIGWPAAAEEPARRLRIETEIPQRGDYMCVGFGSLWMMSEQKLKPRGISSYTRSQIGGVGRLAGQWPNALRSNT
jgi:hypothetical protein